MSGTDIFNQINADILDNTEIRSTLTHYTSSKALSADGGYSASTETSGSGTTLYGVPFNLIHSRHSAQRWGELAEGEIRFIIKGTVTITMGDRIDFRSKTYKVRDIREFPFNDVIVAKVITLKEGLD